MHKIGSFSFNVEDNIEKTRKKAGMIFSSNFDRRKVNPFIYIKFWGKACLPYCMALSSLLLHHLCMQNLNDVSNGSSKIFSMYQISLP